MYIYNRTLNENNFENVKYKNNNFYIFLFIFLPSVY